MKPGEVARNLSRGAFFLGAEKAVASASTLLYSALIARWLGPTKYGMFTLAFSVVTLATAFTGNFETYLERYAAEYQVQGRIGVLRRAYALAFGWKFALGLMASGILVAIAPWVAERYRIEELGFLLPLLTAFIFTDAFTTTGRALLFGLQRFEWVSGLSLFFNLGRTALVWALWHEKQGLRSLAIGMSALAIGQGLLIGGATLFVLARHRGEADPDAGPAAEEGVPRGLFHQMVAYCAPLYGANLSFLSGQNLGKLVLGMLLDPQMLGYFSFAFGTIERFVEVVHALPRALLPSLTQIVALRDRERLHYVFGQAFRLVQVVACLLSFGLFVYAREIILLVGSPLFEPAVPLLRILALVPLVRTAQQPLTMLFQALRRPGDVLLLALVKLVAEIGGYFALLLPLGVAGACWANLAGALAAFTGAMILAHRQLPEGDDERLGAIVRGTLLLAPAMLLTLGADTWLGPERSLFVRLPLAIPIVLGIFALGLVNRYDLEKLSSLKLPSEAAGTVRDRMVAAAERLIRVFEPRRTA